MKSKSFELKQSVPHKGKHNKSFDFVGFYKSTAETNRQVTENSKPTDNNNLESPKLKKELNRRELSANKPKKKLKNEAIDISLVGIKGHSANSSFGGSTPSNDSKITSTPISSKSQGDGKVKSIMKTKTAEDHPMDGSEVIHSPKPKKRNKSVSFMLEDTEGVVIKKTKSDDSINKRHESKEKITKNKKYKKFVKDKTSGKENKVRLNQKIEDADVKNKESKSTKPEESVFAPDGDNQVKDEREKVKKIKKNKINEESEESKPDTNIEAIDTKVKKLKKKKRHVKQNLAGGELEGEPVSKSAKKDIAEDLENLNIGDNAHTLSNLLDEMTVVDKDKKKNHRQKFNKNKRKNQPDKTEQEEEGKEKIKWNKRKWNKDKKGALSDDIATMIIVENLPISIMLTYRKLLADHFGKYGLIKKIGIAEMYPTEESKPVFTTTVNFYSDGAATDALEQDNTVLEGSRIRVKRPLPPTETTLVIRSYAELNEQSLTTLFTGAGKIRNIRHLVKGKKSSSTAFVEFDGPESVERAIKMAANAKVGGKKVHVAKYQIRKKKEQKLKSETDSGTDTEDSDD